jgi:putative transcriptional regulator
MVTPNFKLIRTRLGVTQAEIAAPLGVTQSNISFYETGQTVPPLVAGKLIAYAKKRGVKLTFDDIYGDGALKLGPPAPQRKRSKTAVEAR